MKSPAKKNLEKKQKISVVLEKWLEENYTARNNYKALTIPSTIFLASEKSIIVLSL